MICALMLAMRFLRRCPQHLRIQDHIYTRLLLLLQLLPMLLMLSVHATPSYTMPYYGNVWSSSTNPRAASKAVEATPQRRLLIAGAATACRRQDRFLRKYTASIHASKSNLAGAVTNGKGMVCAACSGRGARKRQCGDAQAVGRAVVLAPATRDPWTPARRSRTWPCRRRTSCPA